ncbi:hypothetical protein DV735_g5508, partial [Chaetothyriales sp. CBS 134920]
MSSQKSPVTQVPSDGEREGFYDIDTKTPSFDVDSAKEEISDLVEPQDTTKNVGFWEALTRRNAPRDLDAIATERSVFDDPSIASFYQPPAEYENVHRFDPQARWTYREERSVRRKTDFKIFVWILVMFFGLNIDRGNLGNAAADNLLKDLHINTNDFNNAQNMYRIGFLIAEVPSQMIGKRLGPDRWIPVQIMLWSLASGGQFFIHGRSGFFACRFFIGLCMGGFIPDSILYLSYFYKKTEMPIRLALFWFVDSMSGVIASFMAYGILHMRGIEGKEGWRWLFLIEALVSFVIGAASFLFLVPGPTQTKTWWNPKGYFNEREETIIVNRVLRDDPSKSDMHNRESLSLGMLWKSLKDYDLWPVYLIGILFEIPTAPPKTYLTLSLRALGFSTFHVTLLVIPVTVFAAVNMLWVTFLTERFHQIAIIGLLSQVWVLPLLIVEYTSIESLKPWAQYALTFMILGQPSTHAAHVGWCSRLSNAVRTRAISAALYNITIQLSGIASSNIYREDDKPHYHRGNKDLIAICVATIFAYAFAKTYYTLRNKSKRAKWNSMSEQEKAVFAKVRDTCCGGDTEVADVGAAKLGCDADVKADKGCAATNPAVAPWMRNECLIFAASTDGRRSDDKAALRPPSQQSNGSEFHRALERYKALLDSARCICRTVLEEKGISCCAQKKLKAQPGRSSQAKVESGYGTKAKPSEKSCSSKAKDCCTTPRAGQTGACSSAQSGCCTRTTSPPPCRSTPAPRDVKKGGSCCSTAVEIVSNTGTSSRVKRTAHYADPENDSAFEHVALSAEGMTCNDCAEKLVRTLNAIPGIHNIRVNFVRGQADFDIEQSLVSVDSVLTKARTATGFIINRIKQGTDETLHLLVSGAAARALSELDIEGLSDVTVINKTTVSVDYDPTVVGARDLLEKIGPLSKGLASPAADPAVSGSRRKFQKLVGMTVASAILTIPVVTLAWGQGLVSEYTRGIVSFALGSLVQLLAIPVFYKPALRALIVSHTLELDMLVVVSITAAYLYSVVAFSFRLAGRPLEPGEFFETSTLLITLVMLGRLLASYARIRAVAAVSMRSLQSTTALLVHEDSGVEREIDSRLLQYGDLFKVLPHCRIPTDGVVVEGISDVDESMLTGESIPVVKQPGSNVIAGTMNSAGTLLVRLSELPGKNTVMDIARMVDDASNSKPAVQDLADHIASYFLPIVSVIALVVFIIWLIVGVKVRHYGGGQAVAVAITYAIAALAVSCPCAIGLAVPMVLVIAGGIAAHGGVIVKSSECIERSRKVTDVVLDKTGTLTESDLDVLDEDFFCSDRDEVVGIIKSMVSESKHPVSMAVAKYLAERTNPAISISGLQSIPGFGVEARRGRALFRAGNAQWTGHQEHPKVQQFLRSGLTVLLVTRDSTPVALFGLRTRIRPEAAKVVAELKRRSITVHLVSGDQPRAVDAIAAAVGIDSTLAVAQYTPEQKQKYVADLIDEQKYVLFCGDGTNDAVAVAQANIGAQVCDSVTSSDVTGGAADVILLSGLNGIPFLLDVSKASYRRIVFNFAWSTVYNLLAVLLAAGAFVKIRIPAEYAGAGELVSVLPVIAAAMSMLLLNLRPW